MNKKGFTLIELLVVVLIIGILSSVALPQYTTAVEKARASEAWSTMKAINDAQAVRNMEMGTTDTVYNLDELSIEVPQTSKNFCYALDPSSGSSVNFGNCSCYAYGNYANTKTPAAAWRCQGGSTLYVLSFNGGRRTCWGYGETEKGISLCKSIVGGTSSSANGGECVSGSSHSCFTD